MADKFKPCSVAGCNGNAHYLANGKKGWCAAHHWRWRKHGDPLGGSYRSDNSGACIVSDCEDGAYCKSYCIRHYKRFFNHGNPMSGGTTWGDPERFFNEMVVTYTGDDCLTWPFARNSRGYGHIRVDGRMMLVTRRVCEIQFGPPSPDDFALHSCGNGHLGCVNPKHLRWGTQTENMADRATHKAARKK